MPPAFGLRSSPIAYAGTPSEPSANPAHVTVIYHDEAPSLTLLRERLAAVAASVPAFEIVVGAPRCFSPPASGVFLEVADPSASVDHIREQVLFEPFRPRTHFGLHATILHPDQGHRPDSAWPELSRLPAFGSMRVAEVVLVGGSNEVIDRFRLVAPNKPLQPTSGGRAEGGCGSMGSAGRG